MRYLGVFGWRWSFRLDNEELKSEDVNGIGESGFRASDSMVIGRAKREESAVKLLNAFCRS